MTTGVSVSIAGKTGSGKTTLLSYLLNNLDERQRIVTIEETREILIVNPVGDNGVRRKSVLALCTRPSDEERMDIDMRALLRTALRLRPDIITMAEMRGPEALDAQEAARTGHTVASTLHANSATQAYARMMTMCQMGAVNVPAHHPHGPDRGGFPHRGILPAAGQQPSVHHGGRRSLWRAGRRSPHAHVVCL